MRQSFLDPLMAETMSAVKAGGESDERDRQSSAHSEMKKKRVTRKGRRGKLRFDISFDGRGYSGWQYHPGKELPAVYTVVAEAWARATSERPGFGPVAAARLDAGVSADHQICSVRTQRAWTDAELHELVDNMNAELPADVRCLRVLRCPVKFHAINAATWKRYGYTVAAVANLAAAGAALPVDLRCWWRDGPQIDEATTRAACTMFVGTHDFRRFTARSGPWSTSELASAAPSQQPVRSAVRTIHAATVTKRRHGSVEILHISFQGGGFLKHQVRRMVGAAVAVGTGELELGHLAAALRIDSCDGDDGQGGGRAATWDAVHRHLPRPLRSFEAPAVGLTLEKIHVE